MKKGHFLKQPYFTEREIDRICIEKLKKFDCLPQSPAPVRIDRFIEKCFGIVPEYDDLPNGVLGYTQFNQNGVEAIYVSRKLDEAFDKVSNRRVRTTLAHEAGHGFMHAELFMFDEAPLSLFPEDVEADKNRILCREEHTTKKVAQKRYDGRWWELQANRAMSSLLLPKPLVIEQVSPMLVQQGLLGIKVLENSDRIKAERMVSDTFEVNPIVARIRIENLFPVQKNAQLTL